jgi:hypothetical protein
MSNVPRLPQELIEWIIDVVGSTNRCRDLLQCSLVDRQWVNRSQHHLSYFVTILPRDIESWRTNMPISRVDDPTKSIEHLTLGEICKIGGSQFLWTANAYGDSLRPLSNVKDLTLVLWNVMCVRPPVDQAAFFPFRERLRELTLEHVSNVNVEWVWDILHVFPHLRCEHRPPVEERTPGGVEELHIFSCNAPLLDIFSQSAYPFQLRTAYLEDCRLNSIHKLQRLIVASASTPEVLEIRRCMYPCQHNLLLVD